MTMKKTRAQKQQGREERRFVADNPLAVAERKRAELSAAVDRALQEVGLAVGAELTRRCGVRSRRGEATLDFRTRCS